MSEREGIMSTPDSLSQLIERLKLAETRLEKSEARLKEATSQRNDYKRALAASEKKLEKLEAREAEARRMLEEQKRDSAGKQQLLQAESQKVEAFNASLNEQTTALIAENRRLSDEMIANRDSLEKLMTALQDKDTQIEAIKAQMESDHKQETSALQEKFQAERKRFEGQLSDLSRQVQAQGKQVSLSPERASDLINRLVDQMRLSMPALSQSSGEVHLKVAFVSTGTTAGFVIPTLDSPPEIRSALHEITLRFDKTPIQSKGLSSSITPIASPPENPDEK
jgi:chromosome segregation ATPase